MVDLEAPLAEHPGDDSETEVVGPAVAGGESAEGIQVEKISLDDPRLSQEVALEKITPDSITKALRDIQANPEELKAEMAKAGIPGDQQVHAQNLVVQMVNDPGLIER